MAFCKPPVKVSDDFNRVRGLPVRGDGAYPPNLTLEMTNLLRAPGVTHDAKGRPLMLKDKQAQALWDLGTYSHGYFPLRVGAGKTLISFLAPRMINAQRPLLVVPGGLLGKTEREWHEAAKYWRVSQQLRIKSYDFISRVSGAQYLDTHKPDMIVADEMHKLKNPRAAVTRRFRRYMETSLNCTFVPLGGTPMKKSIKDFAHLLEWSHGSGSPTPLYAQTLLEWAEALDENPNSFTQRDPGVLSQLIDLGDDEGGPVVEDARDHARRVFQKRLLATPGIVVADAVEDYTGSLNVSAIEYDVNSTTEENFKALRETNCRPDGWALTEAVQIWAVARQLALGMHYVWDPSPPQEWLDARKQWAAFVRDVLAKPSAMHAGIDSELQVTNAVLHGHLEDEYGLLDAWRKIKPTFDINSREVWHDDSALNVCAEWLGSHPKGICWVEHTLFGRELSRRTGLPYFGAAGKQNGDSAGAYIEDADGPVIASIAANITGRNLQFKWHENLVTAPMADSERWEQLIGRTHRQGQEEDEVNVECLVGAKEHLEAIPRAISSSDVKEAMLGFRQKLHIATIDWPAMTGRRGARWT
jgi:hypothetical protein